MSQSSMQRIRISPPSVRRLRAFAFDPVLSQRIETHDINEIIIKLPWDESLQVGPVDDYLEIVDVDPASRAFYAPVNLNDPYLLAQDGLPPSEGNPQFHQQMVYAVARTTIAHFERALGRRALWAPGDEDNKQDFVERLRIYPHGLREANAYYTPAKKALLFGYFPASASNPGENLPGGLVFTCLSHDIVAHETTHALLDGLHRRFIEPTNADTWALHEGFADIVALFQHFSYPEVLRSQIARTRGQLESQNLLGELAYQFGQAIGRYGALRSAIGHVDPQSGTWIPEKPDPAKLLTTAEPHARGAILVAAVFDAFLTIYKRRIVDLLRIATGGSGILPPGDLHPDLVERLAQEASKTARHILRICIRALDYCPPVDLDFGDYLRALITADVDLVGDDPHNYRLAIIEAFRQRGIYPRDVRSLSEESLIWNALDDQAQTSLDNVFGSSTRLSELVPDWGLITNRKKIFEQTKASQRTLHGWLMLPEASQAAEAAQLVLGQQALPSIYHNENGLPTLEVHSVRPARRIGPEEQTITDLVVEITQRRRGYFNPDVQSKVDRGEIDPPEPDFIFRGGCTLLIDPVEPKVRYCIYKRILSENRLDRMRRYLTGRPTPSLRATYLGEPQAVYFQGLVRGMHPRDHEAAVEPLALLHRSFDAQEAEA